MRVEVSPPRRTDLFLPATRAAGVLSRTQNAHPGVRGPVGGSKNDSFLPLVEPRQVFDAVQPGPGNGRRIHRDRTHHGATLLHLRVPVLKGTGSRIDPAETGQEIPEGGTGPQPEGHGSTRAGGDRKWLHDDRCAGPCSRVVAVQCFTALPVVVDHFVGRTGAVDCLGRDGRHCGD